MLGRHSRQAAAAPSRDLQRMGGQAEGAGPGLVGEGAMSPRGAVAPAWALAGYGGGRFGSSVALPTVLGPMVEFTE